MFRKKHRTPPPVKLVKARSAEQRKMREVLKNLLAKEPSAKKRSTKSLPWDLALIHNLLPSTKLTTTSGTWLPGTITYEEKKKAKAAKGKVTKTKPKVTKTKPKTKGKRQ